MRILCSGSATLDTIFRLEEIPSGPGKVLPSDVVQSAHGMAASAAAAVAALGGEALLHSRVGDDEVGARIVADLVAAGIDCRHVRRVAGARSPLSTVLVDRNGERLVVPFFDPALGRDATPPPLAEIETCGAVLVDVRRPDDAAEVLRAARRCGVPAVLDADTGPAEAHAALFPLSTHAIFSEPAALVFSGEERPLAALERLAARHDGFVSITLGPEGCIWFDRQARAMRRIRPPRITAVDTLAAGDVFHGAFALMLAEGRSLEDCIRFANVAAAIKCTVFGGRKGTPSRPAVEALLAASAFPVEAA